MSNNGSVTQQLDLANGDGSTAVGGVLTVV